MTMLLSEKIKFSALSLICYFSCMKYLKYLLEYVFPLKCLMCSEMVMQANGFCSLCWNKLSFITKPFCNLCGKMLPFSVECDSSCLKCMSQKPIYDMARGVLKFDEESKKLIHHFKYYDKTTLAKIFALNMLNQYSSIIQQSDLIIPVPMHRFKRMLRFYNHAFILAKELASIAHKSVLSDVLIKSKWTKSQAKLSKKERDVNLANSFELQNTHLIKNKKILLIDDVLTTSATANACSKLLKKHAQSVSVLVVALT